MLAGANSPKFCFLAIDRKMKLIFADIMRELKASGYHVSARLMNAMYYGVRQSRQRMIFVGVREDLWNSIRSQ